VELERDIGLHTIEAAYGGAAPLREKRELTLGAHEVVTLVIPAPKPGEVRSTGGGGGGGETGNKSLRGAGIAALVIGGVGIVGGAISLALRQSALASLDVCAPNNYMHCPVGLMGQNTQGQIASTLLGVFGAVAGVGLVAGIPMVVVSRPSAPAPGPTSGSVAFQLVSVAGGAAVLAGGRF
jgi:hypothetical protein